MPEETVFCDACKTVQRFADLKKPKLVSYISTDPNGGNPRQYDCAFFNCPSCKKKRASSIRAAS